MGKATGIGGVFFKAEDPAALAAWYRERLGVGDAPPFTTTEEHGTILFHGSEPTTPPRPVYSVWSPFPADTDYFQPSDAPWMLNLRVDDLDALLARLAAAGVTALGRDDGPFGNFAWVLDPEGNKVELWQPPSDLSDTAAQASQAAAEREALVAIERLHRRDVEASQRGDFATLRSLTSDGAVVLPPGQPPQRGRAEVDAAMRAMEEAFRGVEVLDYRMDFEEVLVLGDHAVEWGTIEGSMRHGDGAPIAYRYNLMRVLRRGTDGEWQVHRTIWNQAPPPPPAADPDG